MDEILAIPDIGCSPMPPGWETNAAPDPASILRKERHCGDRPLGMPIADTPVLLPPALAPHW